MKIWTGAVLSDPLYIAFHPQLALNLLTATAAAIIPETSATSRSLRVTTMVATLRDQK